jgi:teichuronic acid biosynthesis glycosyltransferase TuaG
MISILMPIYNGIEFIDESVSSILSQTYTEWELLIGINGHPEKSEVYQIAKKYETKDPRIKVYDFPHLKGKSPTLNHMVSLCNINSKYISLLDVDDAWGKHKLEVQSKYFGVYDVIGTKCIYFGDKNGVVPDLPLGHINQFNFYKFNPIINSSAVIRKELCNWQHEWLEDYDLWLTLWKKGKKFYNCDKILVKHRIHNNSAFNAKGNHLKVKELLQKHMNEK